MPGKLKWFGTGIMMLRDIVIIVAGVLLETAAFTSLGADSPPIPDADYSVSGSWPVGGSGGWDYLALEAGGARLFVSRGDRVDVIETAGGKRIAGILHTAGVHGIAFAPGLARGYTSNGAANTVSMFDLATLRVVLEAPVSGRRPDAILFEPQHEHVFTANAQTANLSVLDAKTLDVVATITLQGKPEFMATDGAGTVYANIESEAGKLVAVDAKSFTVKATWALPGCANPTGLALDAAHHRLFSVCSNQVMVVTDSSSGKQIARVLIGAGPDAAVFDAELGLVFSSNGLDGTLTVIHQDTPDSYRVTATVTTQLTARTMALDPATHKIYLAAAKLTSNAPDAADKPGPSMVPNSFVILVAKPR
jgi:YVTN family beta-propeller protein